MTRREVRRKMGSKAVAAMGIFDAVARSKMKRCVKSDLSRGGSITAAFDGDAWHVHIPDTIKQSEHRTLCAALAGHLHGHGAQFCTTRAVLNRSTMSYGLYEISLVDA